MEVYSNVTHIHEVVYLKFHCGKSGVVSSKLCLHYVNYVIKNPTNSQKLPKRKQYKKGV